MFRSIVLLLFFLNIHAQEIQVPVDDDILRILEDSNIKSAVAEEPIKFEDELEEFQKNQAQDSHQKNNIFGFNYLNSLSKSLNSTSDIPVPADYIISIGDTLKIILTGTKSSIYSLEVKLDGTILFPDLGQIIVSGLEFSEAANKVKDLVSASYIGVDVNVALQSLTAKKITVIGAVKKPGMYVVNPFSTISNALAFTGGVADYASLREIILIRGNERFKFDLYDFLVLGDRSNDKNIQSGDIIQLKSTNKFVYVNGFVNRPMVYEYLDSENVEDLINFALGFTAYANKSNLSISSFKNEESGVGNTDFSLIENPNLKSFIEPSALEIFGKEYSSSYDILVSGPVLNSGYFSIDNYKNLNQLFDDIQFNDDLYEYVAVLENDYKSILFSPIDESTRNHELAANDRIFFFKKGEPELILGESLKTLSENSLKMMKDYSLKITMDNRKFSLPVFGKFKVAEILDYLGSIDPMNVSSTYISPLDDVSLSGLSGEMEFYSEKFHELFIESSYTKVITVQIGGEIKFPGTYTLSENATISDLYQIAGNIKDTADSDVALFSRQSVAAKNREAASKAKKQITEFLIANAGSGSSMNPSITTLLNQDYTDLALGRISGNFTYQSKSADAFILEDGDRLFIPKKISTISIIGEVLNPITLLYDADLSLNEYIEKAGGFKQFALKNSVYVIKSDGTVVLDKGFFRRTIDLEPGDTIVVPRDIEVGTDLIALLVPLTSILSNLAFASQALKLISE